MAWQLWCILMTGLLALASQAAAQASTGTNSVAASSTLSGSSLEATSIAGDAAPSTYILSSRRAHRVTVPLGTKLKERHRMAARLPAMQPMTAGELKAAYVGAHAPGAAPSSDYLPAGQGVLTAQSNGVAGATYSDSRFGSGADYASIASRRVGLLLVRFANQWYQCTASVINRALLLTAAHCVCDYGKGATCFPDRQNGQLQVRFQPGSDNGNQPMGTWTAAGIMVLNPYSNGTDTGDGVAVNNDVALVWLNPVNVSTYIGDITGYLGYAYNGYSFTAPVSGYGVPTAPATAQLTQFGYPADFDNGARLQISNAATYMMTGGVNSLKNIIRGSSMTGGSSGGPWIANYGISADLTPGVTYGSNSDRNVVMGVTSWGYDDDSYKIMGASAFGANKEFPAASYGVRGAGNIGKLMYDACDNPAIPAWNLKAKKLCV